MSDKAEAQETKGSIFSRVGDYVTESIEELKKVHTPTRQETIKATWVTIIIVGFISICLFMLDLFFNWIMSNLMA